MYCSECGTKINDDCSYCYHCGKKIHYNLTNKSKSTVKPTQMFFSDSKQNHVQNFSFKRISKIIKLHPIISLIIAIVSICSVYLFISTSNFDGPHSDMNKTPQSVTRNFFKAIKNEDVDLLLSCIKDGKYLDEYGDPVRDQTRIEGYLHEANALMANRYGSNWYHKLKVDRAESFNEEDYPMLYYLNVSISSEANGLIMIEESEGRYYIEPYGANRSEIEGYQDIVGR